MGLLGLTRYGCVPLLVWESKSTGGRAREDGRGGEGWGGRRRRRAGRRQRGLLLRSYTRRASDRAQTNTEFLKQHDRHLLNTADLAIQFCKRALTILCHISVYPHGVYMCALDDMTQPARPFVFQTIHPPRHDHTLMLLALTYMARGRQKEQMKLFQIHHLASHNRVVLASILWNKKSTTSRSVPLERLIQSSRDHIRLVTTLI